MSVYLYTVFCENENLTLSRWDTDPVEICPNNKDHTVKANSLKLVKTINKNEVFVVPELNNTNGRFRAESKTMIIPANDTKDLDLSWPIDIGVRSVSFTPTLSNDGDIFNCFVFPNTIIGTTGSDLSKDDNSVLIVSPKFNLLQNGFLLDILDPNTGTVNECEQIISIDIGANTVVFEKPLYDDFPQGSIVRFTVNNMRNFILSANHIVRFKSLGSTNSFIPKNSIVRIRYQNTKSMVTRFNFHYEYFY